LPIHRDASCATRADFLLDKFVVLPANERLAHDERLVDPEPKSVSALPVIHFSSKEHATPSVATN
jgi:hypothetical protein